MWPSLSWHASVCVVLCGPVCHGVEACQCHTSSQDTVLTGLSHIMERNHYETLPYTAWQTLLVAPLVSRPCAWAGGWLLTLQLKESGGLHSERCDEHPCRPRTSILSHIAAMQHTNIDGGR